MTVRDISNVLLDDYILRHLQTDLTAECY